MSDTAYLNARVSTLAGRLLGAEELRRLAEADAGALDRRLNLEFPLDELPANATTIHLVEKALIQALVNELSLLVRPMLGKVRDLTLFWARKFELFNLKALIRGKLNQCDEQEIEASLHDLPDSIGIPHQGLLRTESVLELLRQMERGPYAPIASQARQVYEERHEPFALEATIDQRYYAGLVKRVWALEGEDLKEMQALLGLMLDCVNLTSLLRYRLQYDLSATETYYLLVPSFSHMDRQRLKTLVNLTSLEAVQQQLPEPLRQLLAEAGDIAEVEQRMKAWTSGRVHRILAYSRSGVARALAYLVLRELELHQLFSIAKAHLLGLDRQLLRLSVAQDLSNIRATGDETLGSLA